MIYFIDLTEERIMSLTKDQIRTAAMELDAVEREALAEELLLSVDGADRDRIDAAWLAEVRRRDSDFIAGKTGSTYVEDVI